MTCTPHHYRSGDKIESNEMGGACSAYGEEERRIQGFGIFVNSLAPDCFFF